MSSRFTLFLDADDTLWENNVYFERAIEHFYQLVAPEGGDRTAMRERINSHERQVIAEIGYGLVSFRVALTRVFQDLAPDRWNPEAADAVEELAARIAAEPIELVPEAEDTLRYLAPRHRLVLMTKGDYAEQTRKVELSGLKTLFEQVHVVPEKTTAVYRSRVEGLAVAPETCWMIGNSPKSDINPALEAGLNAVLIPHPWTWVLEQDAVAAQPGRRFLQLERLADLRRHF